MKDFNIVLFDDFETLDVFGPAEIIGRMSETYNLDYFSLHGGKIKNNHNVIVSTKPFLEMNTDGILLVPGGIGTRTLVNDFEFIQKISSFAQNSEFVLTICTGSALIAKTGLLDGRFATSNKMAFDWVKSINSDVNWIRNARWVVDGNIYTSSGVSAGMDMTLGFISDVNGQNIAEKVAYEIEYIWNSDKNFDPFAK